MYAAAHGLWVTNDGGASWFPVRVASDEYEFPPDSITTISDIGDRLVASGYGLLFSFDGGKGWHDNLDNDLWKLGARGDGVNFVLVSQSDYSTIYVSMGNEDVGGGFLIKSKDGGKSWLQAPPVRDKSVAQMSISPLDANLIFACTRNGGIFRSSDGMGSWEPVNNTLPNQGNSTPCVAILASRFESGKILAIIDGYGLHVSTDKGDSWMLLAPFDKEATTIVEDKNGTMLAGTTTGIWQLNQP